PEGAAVYHELRKRGTGKPAVPDPEKLQPFGQNLARILVSHGEQMLVLGIETTCDETAAAVVEWQGEGPGKILSDVVLSQINEYAVFGGVVPEIAARAHVEALDGVIGKALTDAGRTLDRIDGIAAAAGPGL